MNDLTPHRQGAFERPAANMGQVLAQTAKAACDWMVASFAAGCDLSFALGVLPPIASVQPAQRAYRVVVVSTTSVHQHIVAFMDSPTLFDQPLDQVAEAVLSHLAKSYYANGRAPLHLKSARRSEDLVLVHCVFLAGADEFEFVAFAWRN